MKLDPNTDYSEYIDYLNSAAGGLEELVRLYSRDINFLYSDKMKQINKWIKELDKDISEITNFMKKQDNGEFD